MPSTLTPTKALLRLTGFRPWGVFCVLFLALTPALPAQAKFDVGSPVTVVNRVHAKNLNRQIKPGDKVAYQETVSTGPASAVEIKLIDESTLVMGEQSEMELNSLVYNPNRGVVEGVLTFAGGLFRFSGADVKMDVTFKTAMATIGIRGTKFDVLANQTETEVAVHEGVIEVTSATGTERVQRGEVYRVNDAGIGKFQAAPSATMKRGVAKMLGLVAQAAKSDSAAKSAVTPSRTATATPAPTAALKKAVAGKDPRNLLYLDTTKGRLVIELLPDLAPKHVARIRELARQGTYDDLDFVFVSPGYAAEVNIPTKADPKAPARLLAAEFSHTPFERGTVAMSRKRNDPNSAESQFFITLGRAANLDGKYTVIGRVIHGLDVADRLQPGKPPKNPDRIETLRVGSDVKD